MTHYLLVANRTLGGLELLDMIQSRLDLPGAADPAAAEHAVSEARSRLDAELGFGVGVAEPLELPCSPQKSADVSQVRTIVRPVVAQERPVHQP